MPRPRQNGGKQSKSQEGFEGLSFLQRLILLVVTFAAVWGAVQVGIPLLSQFLAHTGSNMQLASVQLSPDPSWTLESTTENKAGFFCDDKKAPCPSKTTRYISSKPVTPKQLDKLVYSSKIKGTCKPTGKKQGTVSVCEKSGKVGLAAFEAYVLDTNAKGENILVVTTHLPTPVTKK